MLNGRGKLKIMHVNANKCKRAMLEINQLIIDEEADLVAIQEPGVNGNMPMKLAGYEAVCIGHTQSRVKAATYIKRKGKLNVMKLTQYTTENVVTIELNTEPPVVCINAYAEPQNEGKEAMNYLEYVIKCIGSNKRIILVGDLNGRSKMWKDMKNNIRGNEVAELLTANALQVVNACGTPTFERLHGENAGRSIIDLTIVTNGIKDSIQNWKVMEGRIGSSDHHPICFEVTKQKQKYATRKTTRKYKVDLEKWEDFDDALSRLMVTQEELLERMERRVIGHEEIDQLIGKISEIMGSACQEAFGRRANTATGWKWDRPYTWNQQIAELNRDVRRIKNRIRRAVRYNSGYIVNQATIEEARETQERLTAAINAERKRSFKEMVESVDARDPWNLVKKVVKTKKSDPLVGATMRVNGIYTHDEHDTAKKILAYFYPKDDGAWMKNKPEEILQADEDQVRDDDTDDDERELDYNEIMEAMAKINPKKAPGEDGFTSDICKRAMENHPQIFHAMYNMCHRNEYFPKNWKVSVCVLIPKTGENDPKEVSSWRPLGMLNVLGKVYEAVIINRINYGLKRRNIISSRQFGFSEGVSSVDALQSILKTAKDRKKQGLQVAIMSMDIQGAFDRAKWNIMKERLNEYKVNRKLRKIVDSYLSDREVWLPVGNGYEKKSTNQGCVQGSVAGPSLWNLVINDLLTKVFEEGVELYAYADDITVVISARFARTVVHKASRVAERLRRWGESNGLQFNPRKTMYMPVTVKLRKEYTPVQMDGKKIFKRQEIKVLGMTLDSGLTFKQHIIEVTNKAHRAYSRIGSICAKMWGAESDVLTKIYEAGIRPIVTYACEVWAEAINKKTIASKLHTFQRRYLLAAAKAYRTTSREALEALTCVPPIDLYIQKLTQYAQAKKTGEWKYNEATVTLERKLKSHELAHPAVRCGVEYAEAYTQEQVEQLIEGEEAIYTDGSKMNGKAGAAFVYFKNDDKVHEQLIKANGHCSIFKIEAEAIKKALEYVDNVETDRMYICTDSRSVLEAMKDRSSRHKVVMEIQSKVKQSNKIIQFIWTKAHIGIKGNEAADEAAKLATQLAGPSEVEEYPLEKLKTETKRLMNDKWETQFHETTKAGQLKEIIGTIGEAKEWKEATRLDFFLTQVLTGHGGTMAYLKRFKVINTDRCTCGEQQSRDHLIVECPLTRSAYLKAKSELEGKGRRKERIAIVAKAFSSMMEQMWHENQKRIMAIRMNGGPIVEWLTRQRQQQFPQGQ